jgi:hypothetical protein
MYRSAMSASYSLEKFSLREKLRLVYNNLILRSSVRFLYPLQRMELFSAGEKA